MHADLHAENQALRQQLDTLLHEARLNEDKLRRFDLLERQLIGVRSLLDLITLLLDDYRAAFGMESVSLALLDPDGEIARTLAEECSVEPCFNGLLLFPDESGLSKLFDTTPRIFVGAFDAERHAHLFAHDLASIASLAALPILRQGRLIGSLHLGSTDPARYVQGIGTDFLDRLAGVIGICLENILAQEQLRRAGLTDGLTGVQNRRHFDHRCQVEVAQATRHRQALACMFVDIDRFKRINDTYGHPAGDAVLRGVARLIQGQLRTGDTVARYGGEEFVILLPQTPAEHAGDIAERIRWAVAAGAFTHDNVSIPVTISIGLSMLPLQHQDGDDADLAKLMIANADQALYQAKHGGRNRVVAVGLPDKNAGKAVGIRASLDKLRGRLGFAAR